MADPRAERLAELLLGYSVELAEGQVVKIGGEEVAAPLIVALHRAAVRRGAHPYTSVKLSGLEEILLAEGSEEQLAYISPVEWDEVELLDAWVTIWSTSNTRAHTRVDPARHRRYLASHYRLVNKRWERITRGELRWCGTLFPTHAHAQDAEMSLPEYEDFVYGACHVREGEDTIEHWRGVSAALTARARELSGVRELRIAGPDTDLRVVVEGRSWVPSDGRHNMPDGEVFTSPVETGTEGEIRFTFPAIYQGREVEDVRLRFEQGRVVQAEASKGADYLNSLLDTDGGSRVLGEVAFGLNYDIDRFTRDILFDEKIGGTVHLALGAGFPDAGTQNESELHWDLICDLRSGGEVHADGELIWKDGSFLDFPASPENLTRSAMGP